MLYYDSITGLPNEKSFVEELRNMVSKIENQRIAVLIVGINGLQYITWAVLKKYSSFVILEINTILKHNFYINYWLCQL